MPDLLSNDAIAALQAAPLVPAPAGARTFTRSRVLRSTFETAAETLMTWRVHERAGLRVAASAARAGAGEVVLLTLGRGPVSVTAPCRILEVIDEPDRIGFRYGTLAGHPEAGEEEFAIERRGAEVVFTVHAVSAPATRLARLGGPVATLVQDAITARYLRAADA